MDLLGGGSGEKKAAKLKSKATQKYGDPSTRQKAIQQLSEMKEPEALTALLHRFTVLVDPHTTDREEKEHIAHLVTERGRDAIPTVTEFLRRNDQASSWMVRILSGVLAETELVGVSTGLLEELGAQYTRNPEKKIVLIQYLAEKDDPRIAPSLVPYLEDISDDVKLAALVVLGPLAHEPARLPMLEILTGEETARRVQTAAILAVHQSGFGVQGYREKVEARLPEGYFVDKSGLVKKQG